MHVREITVKNFRLLEDVSLALDRETTVIVGRNNSGKTSFTELFRRLFSDANPSFRFEDFSLTSHEQFCEAYDLKQAGANVTDVRDTLPSIDIQLRIKYEIEDTDLGTVSPFIVDLDDTCHDALVEVRYELLDGKLEEFLESIEFPAKADEPAKRAAICQELRSRISGRYGMKVHAVDPSDQDNRRELDTRTLRRLLAADFVSAQRGLDDVTDKDVNLLGRVLEGLLASAMHEDAADSEREVVQRLESAVKDIQAGIDAGFNEQLKGLLPTFTLFGYPGLGDPNLQTETSLSVERLLVNHTRVHYAGINGINLPENYNGLGVRNLVFMLLKLFEFYRSRRSLQPLPGLHLVFVEEPEVHLHPQMQEVFIERLSTLAESFAEAFGDDSQWPVQFVVTTHSSHIANRASFSAMRYFHAFETTTTPNVRTTSIRNLEGGLSDMEKADRDFLHKYMTLTQCDLLFADKAILIEGATERLLLPQMIRMREEAHKDKQSLRSQYVSIIEVGGAYAHVFFPLLDFLQIPALIITDLDSIDRHQNRRACLVEEATGTSNTCLTNWFENPTISPVELIDKDSASKCVELRRVCYQIPEKEDDPCGRSFEDAFMLANRDMFDFKDIPKDQLASRAWELAGKINCKTDFALEYAISNQKWQTPLYIRQGLDWLASADAPLGTTEAKEQLEAASG